MILDIPVYRFTSDKPGKHILLLGCIHGNEPCGHLAIEQIIKFLEHTKLASGSVTCIPICNPEAQKNNVRQVEQNLNRVFKHHENPSTYEQYLANKLIQYVQECDILVDLHSWSTQGAYFVFQDYPENRELAYASNIPTIISWRPELYEKTEDVDTVTYAHSLGQAWIVIEAWQHDETEAPERAYNAAMNILRYYKVIDEPWLPIEHHNYIHMEKMFYKTKEGKLTRPFHHGEIVHPGEILVEYEDWETLAMSQESVMVLPKNSAKVGEEWFYIWVNT